MEPMRNSQPSKRNARGKSRVTSVDKIVAAKVNAATRGRSFRPNLVPPIFSHQPWNGVTLRLVKELGTSSIAICFDDLDDPLCKQLGAYYVPDPANSNNVKNILLEYRLDSMSVWNMGERAFLRVMALDFLTKSRSELVTMDSSPMKNMFACVGYVWPVAHQQHVIFSGDQNKENVIYIDGAPGQIEIHLKMQWRCAMSSDIKRLFVHVPTKLARRHTVTEEAEEALSVTLTDLEI